MLLLIIIEAANIKAICEVRHSSVHPSDIYLGLKPFTVSEKTTEASFSKLLEKTASWWDTPFSPVNHADPWSALVALAAKGVHPKGKRSIVRRIW